MFKKLTLSAFLSFSVAGFAHASTLPDIFSSFYVLGDSNSDFGNLGPDFPPPPYFNNQFSNGPVWADLLDDQFENAYPDETRTWNYAFGGARVQGGDVPDLSTQAGVFLADIDPSVPDPLDGDAILGDRPLLAIWFGANDLRALYESFLETAEQAQASLSGDDLIVALETAQAEARLAAASLGAFLGGAYVSFAASDAFNDFIALTTSDLGSSPEYDDPFEPEFLTDLSVIFNDALTGTLQTLEGTGNSVYLIDTFSLLAEVQANPSDFGFGNVTDACLTFKTNPPSLCADPDSFLFWDDVGHLSATGHAALAGIIEETVLSQAEPSVVPLSGAALPMATGLLALAALRLPRRRART